MHEIAGRPTPSCTLPSPSTICGTTPKNGRVADPGLSAVAPGSGVIMMPPVSVCHQVSTIGQRLVADDAVIPFPGFGVDRLAHRSEQAQRAARGRLHRRLAGAHQGADGGRRGVEDIDLVLVDHLPEARHGDRWARPRTSASSRRSRAGRRRCSCGPSPSRRRRCTSRCRRRDNRTRTVRHRDADEIAAGRVQHALGLAGRAGGVEDEERILGAHRLGGHSAETLPASSS